MKTSRWRVSTVLLAVTGVVAVVAAGGVAYYYATGGRAGSIARHRARAETFLAEGDFSRARLELRTAVQMNPADASTRVRLGYLEEQAGNFSEAVNDYQSAIVVNPGFPAARAALARLMIFSGEPAEARKAVEEGLAQAPDSGRLIAVRAELLSREGKIEAALKEARAAHEREPDDDYVAQILASVLQQSGDSAAAAGVLETALAAHPTNIDLRAILADVYEFAGRRQDAEAQIRAMVAQRPTSLAIRTRLARLMLLRGDRDAAETVLRDASVAIAGEEAKVQLLDFLSEQRGLRAAVAEGYALMARDPADRRRQVRIAQFLLDAGAITDARNVLEFVAEHSRDPVATMEAKAVLASVLLSSGKAEEATALAEEILKKDPRQRDALLVRAGVAVAHGDLSPAISDFRTILRTESSFAPALMGLARAYAQTGSVPLAEETLRKALDAAPNDPKVRVSLATLLIDEQRATEALDLLRAARDGLADPQVQDALVRAYSELRRFREAREAALVLLRLLPGRPIGYLRLGQIEEADGHFEEAERNFRLAMPYPAGAVEALPALVRLYVRRGQNDTAFALVDSLMTGPAAPAAHQYKGDILMALKQVDSAVGEYRAATALAPQWSTAYRALAAAELARNNPQAALVALQDGVQRASDIVGVAGDLAGLSESIGRHEDAIRAYEAALARTPNFVPYCNNLALLLVTYRTDKDSLRRAVDLSEKLAGMPGAAFLDTRGWVQLKAGDLPTAQTLLQQAANELPDEPAIRFHLAMAQAAAGDGPSARRNIVAALDSHREFPERAQAQQLLGRL